MDNSVIIKSNKYGLIVHLEPEVCYDELLIQIKDKFNDAQKFFQNAKMSITFEGRVLTKGQEQEIIKLISETAHIHIVCMIDTNEKQELTYKSIVEQSLEDIDKQDGQFYKGTLQRRQVLESDTSVIILGDVDPGATVVARGNIVVIGTIRGSVYAGASGNEDAFIVALSLNPSSLRIADVEAPRLLLAQKENLSAEPKIAVVDGERIYIDSLLN
ncbi:MAG: septum site-determining protein MinC [Lachnospiraceae bacterium]